MRRRFRSFLFAVLAAALTLASTSSVTAQNTSLISLQSGHSVILHQPNVERIAVGDTHIAGVVPVGNEIVINGKDPGHTTVFIWAGGRRISYIVTVTEQDLDQVASMLRAAITDPNVQVVSFGRSVVVRGTVRDGAQYQWLNDLISRFDKMTAQEKYSIVNAVSVARPLGDLQHDIAGLPGASDIRVDPDGKGNVIVSGRVKDMVTEQAVLSRARGLAGPYLASEGKLIDRLSTDTNSQIDIKLYVLEVDVTALHNLGVQLQSAIFQADGSYSLAGPSYPVVEAPSAAGKGFTVAPFFRTITLAPTLNLLIQDGHARILSSPDLVTTPGTEATFLVGGQIPIPYSAGLGQTSIQYKDFGVQLRVTPALLGNGAVQAAINPDISDLDFQDGVTQNGFFIPALRESRLSTNVIAQAGESVIMGGMVRRVEQRTIEKIPLLGDLPILGRLFRSTNYQNNQTDVVFVMTPQIITR
ncbi:MAG: pilus assembly protein N-terminal domain-containing protein [Candidatus Eremiobacteraeota bacterium]|nr:pilus assembly protein N-terminal domain-containing protein [Candidatus Eremiobacteraeota bacterium]